MEKSMTAEEKYYKIVEAQEKKLHFNHFNNDGAWRLGNIIIETARRKNLCIAIDIVINGYQVFRYGFDGTNNFNDIWLQRKINTVAVLHKSSLRVHYMPFVGEDDIYKDGHLDPETYSNMGGGFPIYVEGIGVVGVVAVSGLTHIMDHDLAVDGVTKFLGTEVERILEE
jgi:uncharacterized protein (UPF0303 family)